VGNLIFVEGVPGSGKSTTAQFLARQLAQHGRPARWIYEEEAPNPFVPEMPPDGFPTWDAFADAHVARWEAFARAAAAAPETVIAESFLLQRPVFTMLRRDVDAPSIEALVNRFADAVAPLRSRLVLLRHPDPAAAWRAIAATRGPDFMAGALARSADWAFLQSRGLSGLDGVLAYWRAHGALCDAIAAQLRMETITLDVSTSDWPARRRQLCASFGVTAAEPPSPTPAELAALSGRYADGQREITIELDGGRLVLRGVLWASNALLPVTSRVFDVEAWPFRLHFDDAGLSWRGPRLWWGGPSGVYKRLPEP
jgi:hypothetical protein